MAGIGANESFIKDAAGKLVEVFLFEGAQTARADLGGGGDLFERDGYFASCLIDCEKVAVFVEISDDRMACKPDVVVDSGKTKLPFEVISAATRNVQLEPKDIEPEEKGAGPA